MPTIYLNIGTNLGDRLANINKAIALIEEKLCCFSKRSEIYESQPWGFLSENPFYNICISVESDINPHKLLQIVKQIECEMGSSVHRAPSGDYADRIIDIDIIAIDDVVITTPELTVPHPHLLDRPFFLIPLKQIAPSWKYPAKPRE